MFQYIRKRQGQSTLEYAILFLIIIAAILTIQTFVKRAIQGRMHSSANDIGDQFTFTNTSNYHSWTNTISNTTQSTNRGVQQTQLRAPEVTNQLTQIQHNADNEYWGQAPSSD